MTIHQSSFAQQISEPHSAAAKNCEFPFHRQLSPTVDAAPTSLSPFELIQPGHLLTSTQSEMSNVQTGKKTRSAIADVVTREYTINLHKRVC